MNRERDKEILLKLYYRSRWVPYLYRRGRLLVLNVLGMVLLVPLYLIYPFQPVKLCLLPTKFPHLAYDLDWFLRTEWSHNEDGIYYLGIAETPVNRQLLEMYKRIFPIVESPLLYDIVRGYVVRRSIFFKKLRAHDEGRFFDYGQIAPF